MIRRPSVSFRYDSLNDIVLCLSSTGVGLSLSSLLSVANLGHQHCITFLHRFEIMDSPFAVTSSSTCQLHVRVELRNNSSTLAALLNRHSSGRAAKCGSVGREMHDGCHTRRMVLYSRVITPATNAIPTTIQVADFVAVPAPILASERYS